MKTNLILSNLIIEGNKQAKRFEKAIFKLANRLLKYNNNKSLNVKISNCTFKDIDLNKTEFLYKLKEKNK